MVSPGVGLWLTIKRLLDIPPCVVIREGRLGPTGAEVMPDLSPDLLSSYNRIDPEGAVGFPLSSDRDWQGFLRQTEFVVDRGNWLFGAISRLDLNWHTEVYEGRTTYDANQEAVIKEYYRTWVRPAHDVLCDIEALEKVGLTVTGADKFSRNYREAIGLLKDDADFFGGEALVDLQDRAIDAHREGRTADLNVFDQ
jgi:hypothetical protein